MHDIADKQASRQTPSAWTRVLRLGSVLAAVMALGACTVYDAGYRGVRPYNGYYGYDSTIVIDRPVPVPVYRSGTYRRAPDRRIVGPSRHVRPRVHPRTTPHRGTHRPNYHRPDSNRISPLIPKRTTPQRAHPVRPLSPRRH